MDFRTAFFFMKKGFKVKLPAWGGYWYWDDEHKTIMMCTKEGKTIDIRKTERVEYTLDNILSCDWIIADELNTPILGGEALFDFKTAMKYLKRGLRVQRKSDPFGGDWWLEWWESPNNHPQGVYLVSKTKMWKPWQASVADMMATDWMIVGD